MVGKVSVFLKIKPSLSSTPDASYYRINSSTEIQLLVPPSNRDPFYFSDIFYQENDTICKNLSKLCSEAALAGTNVSVIAIGAKDSGKTHTIFGDSNSKSIRSSMCYSVINELFESIRKGPKDKNCSITVSFLDIGNQVRDLGLAYYKRDEMRLNQVIESMVPQDLEIKEANGRCYAEDVCIIQIINPDEMIEIVNLGLKVREVLQSAGDAVLCITLSQRMKNELQSARIYLVDYASSSGLDMSEDSKMVNFKKIINKINLTNLSVQVKNIPFKSTKLTYLLQGSLLNSSVMIITNIDSDPKKFKDSYEILNFSKALVEIDKKIKLTMLDRPNSSRTADWARRLREEINELDSNIKKAQTLYEEKLRNFGKLIGIEEDLELLMNAEKGSKEYELCRKHREAIQTEKNLRERNYELEKKAENFKKIMNDLQLTHASNMEKNKRYIAELKSEIREAKDRLEEYDELKEKTLSEKVMSSTENLEKMLAYSHIMLEEKSALIQTLKNQMESNTTDIRSIVEIKELGRAEFETEYRSQILDNEYNHKQRVKSLEDQYLENFKKFDLEIIFQSRKFSQSLRELDLMYEKSQTEAVKLFEIARLQGKAIYDIETGKFNKGISPVLIPRNHIPQIPNESRFPLIFAALGAQALEVARVSSKVRSQFSYTPTKGFMHPSTSKTFSKEPEKHTIVPESSISTLMNTQLVDIKITELISIGNQLQGLIKKNGAKVYEINKSIKEVEEETKNLHEKLEEIEAEKEKYKQNYQKEVRNRIDEAGKNMERSDSRTFMTDLMTRPCTQRNVDTSSKMMRNIHTTISGHRLPLSRSPNVKFEGIRPSTTAAPLGLRYSKHQMY